MHSVGTLLKVQTRAALPIVRSIVQQSVNVNPSSKYKEDEGQAPEIVLEQFINTQSTHYIINNDEEQHIVDYVEYDEIEADMDISAEHLELENDAIAIKPLDVDGSTESGNAPCDNAANRHDSDDDYEADLADKYKSLDRSYHKKASPGSPTNRKRASLVLNSSIMLSMTTAVVSKRSNVPSHPVTNPDAQYAVEQPPCQPSLSIEPDNKRSIVNSDPYRQCYVCGLLVMRMRDHMKTHPDELQFQCGICSRSYLTKTGLDRHMDGQHPNSR